MAKTLVNIRDQVRSFLDEATASDWTDPELNTLINTYYHKVYSAVIDVFEEYSLTTGNITTVADQQEYALPSDFLKMRRVEINYDVSNTDSIPQRALPIPMDAVRRDLGNENLGVTIRRGANYYLSGSNIGFIPVPDAAGTDAIKIWYYKLLTDLSSDSGEIDLPYADRDWILIAWGAASEALSFGQQEIEEAGRLEEKFLRGVQQMQERLEDRTADETKTVIDTSGESLNFEQTYY